MVPDPFDLFKAVWSVVGPHFGTDRASAGFWSYLRAGFASAWALLEPAWNGECGDWIALEERCRHVGLQMGGLLLTVAVFLLNARVVEQACVRCGKRPVRRWRERGLKTTCGLVTLFRQEQACPCGTTAIPADAKLDLPPDDRVSPGLALWTARVGASLPYEPARRFFRDLTGQDVVSAQAIHDQVACIGRAMPELNVVPPATTPGKKPERIALDVDGALVGLHHRARSKAKEPAVPAAPGKPRRQNVHFEVYVGRTYERHDVLCGGKVHLYRHLAFTGGVGRAGDDIPLAMFNLVNQRFPGAIAERTVHVRGDGAQGIDTIANRFPQRKRLLDQFHTLVKITERVKEAFPDLAPKQRRAIDDDLSERLRAGDAESLLERLRALESHPTLGSAEALARLAAHIHRHRDHLWYDEARQLGLGVGTGIAEKDVDLLLDRRYELRGMSWTPTGVRDNLRIRLTLFNDLPAAIEAAVRQRGGSRVAPAR